MASTKRFSSAVILKVFRESKGFDKVWENVKVLSLADGKLKAEMKIEEQHCNPMGGLHGGLSATLVDVLSNCALLTASSKNVSVDIQMRFLTAAKLGDEILIDANVTKKGKSLAFLEVAIKNKNTGDLVVKGSHTMFLVKEK